MKPELKGLQVLVVEDEAMVSMVIEDFLDTLGCRVVSSARLDDAMEKARVLPLDAAVLDVNLAGELSYPVAQILRARGVHVVFATGYGRAGLPPELQDIAVLSKPFRIQQVADALGAPVKP